MSLTTNKRDTLPLSNALRFVVDMGAVKSRLAPNTAGYFRNLFSSLNSPRASAQGLFKRSCAFF